MTSPRERASGGRTGLVLLALAAGGFSIGTTEFATMGLLPYMAHDLGVTIPQAGRYVIWAQVNLDGRESFVPFWVDVLL